MTMLREAHPPELRQIAFFVPTTPIAQGNHRVGHHGQIYDASGAALGAWRSALELVARSVWSGPPIAGAASVLVEFYMPAPKRMTRPYPSVRPDLDKLLRAALDGITGAGIWRDDGQVAGLRARKLYAAHDREIGARFWIGEMA